MCVPTTEAWWDLLAEGKLKSQIPQAVWNNFIFCKWIE